MTNRFSNAIWPVVLGMFAVTGCSRQNVQKADTLAIGPDVEKLSVKSEQANLAIKAAGGLDAWVKTKTIEFDCVATFYQPDGTYYITEQRYEVYPWSSSLHASGHEPQGRYLWQSSKGHFGALQGKSQYDGMRVGVDNGCIAEGILNIITAPVRLLDESVEFSPVGEPVRLEGQFYQPMKRAARPGVTSVPPLRDAVFYQRRSDGRVDMALLGCEDAGSALIVRGYDYAEAAEGGVLFPTKIEVFKGDAGGRVLHRMIQINAK
jgi:hypothetical protein